LLPGHALKTAIFAAGNGTMETNFELPVHYKGQDIMLPMRLITYGYTYRMAVQAGDAEIMVEKDEEGELRALMEPEQMLQHKIDPELVAAIIHSLQQVI
jgi:hypothetical protein